MLQKLKCHQNLNVAKTIMSPKLKPRLKCHQKLNVTKTKTVTKTEKSPKLKCSVGFNEYLSDIQPFGPGGP